MREIRFRAWDKERRFMLYDFDQELPEYYGLRVGDSIHCKVYQVGMLFMTLTQYIGLKDKNGKDIYEGDIVVHRNGIHAVAWDNGSYSFQMGLSDHVLDQEVGGVDEIEVIGNIYENPELLKV